MYESNDSRRRYRTPQCYGTPSQRFIKHYSDALLEALYVSTANSLTVIQTLEELDPEHRVALATTDLFAELVPFLRSGRIRLFV